MVAEDEETGRIVGTLGIADEDSYPILIQPKKLRQVFGFIRGTIASHIMKDEFYQPKSFRESHAHISFVAVRHSARGHRLATRLLEALLARNDYRVYSLDVVEGNERVIPIYESAGFIHTGKEKEKGLFKKGFSFRHQMEYRP